METVEDRGKLQLVDEGRVMIRNRGHGGMMEERGYSSGRDEVSLGDGKRTEDHKGND